MLAESALALALASLAIRLLPFRSVMAAISRSDLRRSPPSAAYNEIARLRWAIEACARRLPWRIVCFQKGLALYKLLERRGIAALLHYGGAMSSDGELKAHVWVTYRGEAIIGGVEAVGYTCLATFPSPVAAD